MKTLKKIVLTGSECTGKSTLLRQLAAHYGAAHSPEFLRDYAQEREGQLTEADIDSIARGQMAVEDEAADQVADAAEGMLLCDTDLFSSVVYNRHYYGACPAWIEQAASERRAGLYLLLDIDLPWQADGQRDRPHGRAALQGQFAEALQAAGCRVKIVRGTGDARQACAVALIDAWLRG